MAEGQPSIEDLAAAGGLAGAAYRVVPRSALADGPLDATSAALVLAGDGALDPEALRAALRHHPDDTPTLLIRRTADGLEGEPMEAGAIGRALRSSGKIVAVALPAAPAEAVEFDLRGLRGVIDRLRDPDGGCPWDLAQDHRSLRPHLLEETHEVLAALDSGDEAALREELGDLLMQIVLHAKLAEQSGAFDLDEVSEGIRQKLVRRHPHVFGEVEAETPEAVRANWERLKADERGSDASVLDGVPRALPALARAQSLIGRAARNGFDWPDEAGVLEKLREEIAEPAAAPTEERAEEFGDVLFVLAAYTRRQGLQAEDALREACEKFERRFRALEAAVRADDQLLQELGIEELLERWERAKSAVG